MLFIICCVLFFMHSIYEIHCYNVYINVLYFIIYTKTDRNNLNAAPLIKPLYSVCRFETFIEVATKS